MATLLLAGPRIAAGQQSGADSNSKPASTHPAASSKDRTSAKKGSKPADSQQSPPANGDNNAFPMAQSQAASQAASRAASQQSPPPADKQAGSAAGKANASQQSPAADNPFPEAQSAAAAAKSNGSGQSAQPPRQAAGAESSSDYSSSDAHLPPQDLGQGATSYHQKMDSYTRDQTQDGRLKDDLNVADFYMKNGDYRGGYLRYEDALEVDPQNETALFGMAEAMCKQNLSADALARFRTYIHQFPSGKYEKKAEKYLTHPYRCSGNR